VSHNRHPTRSIDSWRLEAHGIVERANRTLTRMACSMLTAANLGMEYWSYALRHAAYCDTFLSSSDSLPTPYSFWHGVLEKPRRNIAFGAPLLYRQQAVREKSKQHSGKLDARAHPAIFLGFANDHGAVYVLDKATMSSPIRMTSNDLKRGYCEELVVDYTVVYTPGLIINPGAEALTVTSILATRSMAASAPCELASATWRCWLLGCPYPASMRAACMQQACGIYIQAAHRCLCW
jgi:hypothetical protein